MRRSLDWHGCASRAWWYGAARGAPGEFVADPRASAADAACARVNQPLPGWRAAPAPLLPGSEPT